MRDSVRWASGYAQIISRTVGPRHDPYLRDIVTLTIKGETYSLMCCALAGDSLTLPDGRRVDYHECRLGTPEAKARVRSDFNGICERHTGQTFDFWTEELWDRLRMRRTPEPDYPIYGYM